MANKFRFVLLIAVLIVSARAWPAGQVATSAPSQQPPPVTGATAGRGFVSGVVVDSATGRAIPEAQVSMINRTGTGGRASAILLPAIIADANGRFFFRNLAPGTYALQASKNGYALPRSGVVDLSDGERFVDARIRLAKQAVVSGALRDSSGDPVTGTEVIAFQRVFATGRAVFQTAARGIKSDDRGMYRIPGLTPGEYFVCACLRDPMPFDPLLLQTLAAEPINLMSIAARALTVGSDVVSLDDTLRGYAPTFHPSSRTVAQATRITLAPGEDKIGVDITTELVRATRVSGRIAGAQSGIQAFSARLIPVADAEAGITLTQIQPMLMQADGRFDFANVPPGQYRLIVNHFETGARGGPSGIALSFAGSRAMAPPPAPVRGGGPGAPVPILWANELVVVGDKGVSGLSVGLNQSLSLAGRAQFIGNAPQPTEQMLTRAPVILRQLRPQGQAANATGVMTANGTFRLTGAIPGSYELSVPGPPGFPTLKSITLAGVDISDLPIVVGEKDLGELVVTYSDTPLASLTIKVPVLPGRQPDDDVVHVFPVDKKYWSDAFAARRLFRTNEISAKGISTIDGLPAGDYFMLVEPWTPFPDRQESTLEALSRRAQRVTLSDGEQRVLEVRR